MLTARNRTWDVSILIHLRSEQSFDDHAFHLFKALTPANLDVTLSAIEGYAAYTGRVVGFPGVNYTQARAELACMIAAENKDDEDLE